MGGGVGRWFRLGCRRPLPILRGCGQIRSSGIARSFCPAVFRSGSVPANVVVAGRDPLSRKAGWLRLYGVTLFHCNKRCIIEKSNTNSRSRLWLLVCSSVNICSFKLDYKQTNVRIQARRSAIGRQDQSKGGASATCFLPILECRARRPKRRLRGEWRETSEEKSAPRD